MAHLVLVLGAFWFFVPAVTAMAAREHGRSGWRWFLLGCVVQCFAPLALWWQVRRAQEAEGPRLRVLRGGSLADGVPGGDVRPVDGSVEARRTVLRLVRAGE